MARASPRGAVIPSVITQIASGGQQVRLGALRPTRDFSYVQDTAAAFLATLDSELGLGETVNFGSNYEISIGKQWSLLPR